MFPVKQKPEEETEDEPVPTPGGNIDTSVEKLVKEANDTFEQAINAQRSGNWAEYGSKIKALEELLKRLNELTDIQGNP